MSNIIDISGNHIALLNDADLRALIGRLCEAEYQLVGLPTKGIIWGGNQDAKDGGIDVIVRGEVALSPQCFIPRSTTGFQVKKPDMAKADILKEMRPNGALREEIKSLIVEKGAYVIVSSNGSTTEKALANRVKAMREAVADEDDKQDLHVEFLDRGRIATWVRSHPALILWVRNKIGRQLKGWRPFENWANSPGGIEEEYLRDDGLRMHSDSKATDKSVSVEDGLLELRVALSTSANSVRLAGLSGVGKTRLVQALFDERVGEQALNPNQAFYTDMSDGPDPDPKSFAEQLIAARTKAILIVDNCPPDLHRRLTQTCTAPQSMVSLLTVEYDVREDLPEETSVFRLEPASEGIIEKLIQRRYPHISQVDARTIAVFSGGNARIAIALSNTIKKGETVSGFQDDDLFIRLFWQRNTENENLLKAAEVCSLVYSFEGEDVGTDKSELKILASLIGMSEVELYRNVAELKKRDLVQSRYVWRAVLPHAIANRLANRALKAIPKEVLKTLLYSPERLIKSFSRRLSYLHDCKEAVEIVNDWLMVDGWLGKYVNNFSAFGMQVFKNIAPVSPIKTLEAIERVANGSEGEKFTSRDNNTYFNDFVRLLRHLAYEPDLFERSVRIMCRFALSEKLGENQNSIRQVLKSLFYIYLSGTHAPIEARANIIKGLLNDTNEDKQELGRYLMDAALEAWHFSSFHEFGFGARPRDYGFQPRSFEEHNHWYATVIDICTRFALSNDSRSNPSRKLLADNLRGLWTKAGMFDKIEASAKLIHGQKPWSEGWIAVRSIISYDSKEFDKHELDRLYQLEKLLRPQDLLELARTYALTYHLSAFDDLDDECEEIQTSATTRDRTEQKAIEIGAQVAQDLKVFNELLFELVSTDCVRLYFFGIGLANGCNDREKMWADIRSQMERTPDEKKNARVLLGFLAACAEVDSEFYHLTLDNLISDPVLGIWFPLFQTTARVDQRGIERLHNALDIGIASIDKYRSIGWGRTHEAFTDDELAKFLEKILSKENGFDVVVEILTMRFYTSVTPSTYYSKRLIAVARKALFATKFSHEHRTNYRDLDYDLSKIAPICFDGEDGKIAAKEVSEHLLESIILYRAYQFDYPKLLNCIASAQPQVFLDVFLGGGRNKDSHRREMFSLGFENRENPLNSISDADILEWCDIDPANRYPVIASTIEIFKVSEEGKLFWKPIVYEILAKAPDLLAILEKLQKVIYPGSWSGSRAELLQKRTSLFQELLDHEIVEIKSWAKQQYSYLQEEINIQREREKERDRDWNESFE